GPLLHWQCGTSRILLQPRVTINLLQTVQASVMPVRFANLILTIALLLLPFQWTPFPDPDFELRSSFGIRVLRSGTFRSDNRNGYIYYMERQLKNDLSALFQVAQEIVKEARFNSRSADYKQVSHAANKIRKLASRIKSGLT